MHRTNIVARGAILFSLLSAPALATAEPLGMNDFAYGAELSSLDANFRRFSLSPVMIKDIQHRDLADVRVFDQDNELMPSLVRLSDGDIQTSQQQLALLPLLTDGMTTGYILDRSSNHKQWLKSLQLQWRQNSAPNILPVRIEHSAEQKSWKVLKDSELVTNFKFGDIVLRQNVIDIDSHTLRYIRLSFLDHKSSPVLESVSSTTTATKPGAPSWVSAGRLQAQPGMPGSYHFSVSKGISPSMLRFSFSKLNTVLSGTLYTPVNVNGKLQYKPVTKFSAYKVTLNRNIVNSRPVNLERWQASEWLITTDATTNLQTDDLPEVMVAYPQYEVVFAADGDEPYTAVWGNAKAEAVASDNLRQAIRVYEQKQQHIAEVRTGRILDSAGLTKLMDARRGPWLTLLISLIVIVIVALVARLGYQRYRASQT